MGLSYQYPRSPSAQALGGKVPESREPTTGCSADRALEVLLSGGECGGHGSFWDLGTLELNFKTPQGGVSPEGLLRLLLIRGGSFHAHLSFHTPRFRIGELYACWRQILKSFRED